jgi:hypothetical protein
MSHAHTSHDIGGYITDVYTTKIQKFTKKIQVPYTKNPKFFLLPECSRLFVQVLLRTFIAPNVPTHSDVLPEPHPPPKLFFIRAAESQVRSRWACQKNPKELPKNPKELPKKSKQIYQKNPSKYTKKIQANIPKISKQTTKKIQHTTIKIQALHQKIQKHSTFRALPVHFAGALRSRTPASLPSHGGGR